MDVIGKLNSSEVTLKTKGGKEYKIRGVASRTIEVTTDKGNRITIYQCGNSLCITVYDKEGQAIDLRL